ncbi:MAG TPA: hypothetical protein P5167_04745 [Bacteroidales bacterium]|nr:hypothetical protein [Bacteroidales bacterium]HRW95138.1 hypothetical protein [Bacteroidales bacterium]
MPGRHKKKKRWIAAAIIWAVIVLFRMMPLYEPAPSAPFSGPYWYNPYQEITPEGQWARANFHAHSNAWGVFTNGRKNTVDDILSKYDSLGYDIIGVSDYQHITQTPATPYIPVYEHGFNILKTHQGSIGAGRVYHGDYILPQTRSQKQHILNKLRERTQVLVLNHPDWMGGYSARDMRFLTGYDCFEVLNDFWNSEDLWDVALSSGKPAMIVGGDDAHNVFKQTDLARDLTLIYTVSDTLNPEGIYRALIRGAAYGVEVTRRLSRASVVDKRRNLDSMPLLRSCRIRGDSLTVILTGKAREFCFRGQDGKILKQVADSVNGLQEASYRLQPEDTYVRVKIALPDSSHIYLNPAMRTMDKNMKPLMPASRKRWLFRIFDK